MIKLMNPPAQNTYLAPTPETDAAAAIINRQSDYGMSGYVSADFARKLERQRDALREAVEALLNCEPRHAEYNDACGFAFAREVLENLKAEQP